jgi:DNA-binding transcriptional MerR regulator
MKINQVEELTGISKKNIRFYEEQGLIRPNRDPANGYREYSLADVTDLNRVKLLRKLGISCEDIRRIQDGDLSFRECIDHHIISLSHRRQDLMHNQEICEQLIEEHTELSGLDAGAYLEKISEMEKGGTRFMNVRESDVRKRRTGAIIAAVTAIGLFVILLGVILWANKQDPAPQVILWLMFMIIGSMIIGTILALLQRLKEVQKGEIDEASKY